MRVWVLVAVAVLVIGGMVAWKRAGSRPGKNAAAAADEEAAGEPGEREARRAARASGPAPAWRQRLFPAPFTATASAPPTGQPQRPYEPDAAAFATQERNQQVEAIRATGPESGELLKAAEAISGKWETLSAGGAANVHIGKWECHKAGCFVHVLQRSDATYEDLTSRILDSSELTGWSGQKVRSAPIRKPDGSVEVTWMLLVAPDGGQVAAGAR